MAFFDHEPCRWFCCMMVLFGFFVPCGYANELGPLEVRPSLVEPRVSLPTKLVTVPVISPGEYFVPPHVEDIPDDKYGDMVRWGRDIFVNTQKNAKRYVRNGLNCSNCHLAEGRQPYAAPMWAAYGKYPMYRTKNRSVVTIQERIQDCFRYSLDGIAPTLDSPELEAIVTYMHWLSKDVPIGVSLPGRGFTALSKTRDPSHANGQIIYDIQCALCHGKDGLGKKMDSSDEYMFPPVWGRDSFNRGAGMNKIKTAAQFIKANMPLGAGFTLTNDEALDVAFYMWIQSRPDDPRSGWFFNRIGPKPGGGF